MRTFKDKSALVFVPAYDTPGRKDSSGAFRPEAQRLIRHLGVNASLRLFDNNRAPVDRRKEVSLAFERAQGIELLTFLCHGYKDGIQAGWNSGAVKDLADRVMLACKPTVTIALYCCDTGSNAKDSDDKKPGPGGVGGFASLLHTALTARGFKGTIWAHTTAGHTTWNPFVRVFLPEATRPAPEEGLALAPGAACWAVEPDSDLFDTWRKLLACTTLRYSMLQCETLEEIEAEVQRLRPLLG